MVLLMDDLSLSHALQQIEVVFDLSTLLQMHYDYQQAELRSNHSLAADLPMRHLKHMIVQYYKQSEIGYRKYHSQEGSIHMAINEGEQFDVAGYYSQPQRVAEQIKLLNARMVLEVGSGKGFNSRVLAKQFPDVQFLGLDLTPLHVRLADRSAPGYPNLEFRLGDFNETQLVAESVDIVFGVDCLCHAPDVSIVLSELHQVLQPGGRLVIFDGYRSQGFEQQPQDLQVASQLVELGMAVPMGFRTVQTWMDTAQAVGFETIVCNDLTSGILPTLKRLQSLSYRFFKHPWRARLLKWWAPRYLCRNAIAGLLMPFTCDLRQGTHCYYHLIFEKRP